MSPEVFESHKRVLKYPMTRLEYINYRNWELPEDEDGDDAGYLVEYLDGGTPNDERHAGYISWTPKAQFDNGYTPVELVGSRANEAKKNVLFRSMLDAIESFTYKADGKYYVGLKGDADVTGLVGSLISGANEISKSLK